MVLLGILLFHFKNLISIERVIQNPTVRLHVLELVSHLTGSSWLKISFTVAIRFSVVTLGDPAPCLFRFRSRAKPGFPRAVRSISIVASPNVCYTKARPRVERAIFAPLSCRLQWVQRAAALQMLQMSRRVKEQRLVAKRPPQRGVKDGTAETC